MPTTMAPSSSERDASVRRGVTDPEPSGMAHIHLSLWDAIISTKGSEMLMPCSQSLVQAPIQPIFWKTRPAKCVMSVA